MCRSSLRPLAALEPSVEGCLFWLLPPAKDRFPPPEADIGRRHIPDAAVVATIVVALDELRRWAASFGRRWQFWAPHMVQKFKAGLERVLASLRWPVRWRHRRRTTNRGEGFFRHRRATTGQ